MKKKSNIKNQTSKINVKIQNSFRIIEFCFVILIFTLCFLNLAVAAQPVSVSSTELLNNSRRYDANSVVYKGEVIGDIMMRGDFAWVNVSDGNNAIGVWLSRELAEKIKFTGSYHSIGDQLEITGTFHRNCTQHGGDMDIHAQDMRIIQSGKAVSEELNTTKRNAVYTLLVVLVMVIIFVRRNKKGTQNTGLD
jgi:hypothetical protein